MKTLKPIHLDVLHLKLLDYDNESLGGNERLTRKFI